MGGLAEVKIETKRKIRRWVCKRLGLPETEKVPYPVNVYQATPVTLCAQKAYQTIGDVEEVKNITKWQLAVGLAELLIDDGYCGVTEEDSEVNPELRIVTVSVRVVPWKE